MIEINDKSNPGSDRNHRKGGEAVLPDEQFDNWVQTMNAKQLETVLGELAQDMASARAEKNEEKILEVRDRTRSVLKAKDKLAAAAAAKTSGKASGTSEAEKPSHDASAEKASPGSATETVDNTEIKDQLRRLQKEMQAELFRILPMLASKDWVKGIATDNDVLDGIAKIKSQDERLDMREAVSKFDDYNSYLATDLINLPAGIRDKAFFAEYISSGSKLIDKLKAIKPIDASTQEPPKSKAERPREKPRENFDTAEAHFIKDEKKDAKNFNDFLTSIYSGGTQKFGKEFREAALKALSTAGSVQAAIEEYDKIGAGTPMDDAGLRAKFRAAVQADYRDWVRDAETRTRTLADRLAQGGRARYEGTYMLADCVTGERAYVHVTPDMTPKTTQHQDAFKKKYGGIFMEYPDRFERIVPRGSDIPASVIRKRTGNEKRLWEVDPPPPEWGVGTGAGSGTGTGPEAESADDEGTQDPDFISETFSDVPEPPGSGDALRVKRTQARTGNRFVYAFLIPSVRVGAQGLYRANEDKEGPLSYSVTAKNFKEAWDEMKDVIRLKSGPDARRFTTEEQIEKILRAHPNYLADKNRLISDENKNKDWWSPENILALLKARQKKDGSGWRTARMLREENALLQNAADELDEMRGEDFLNANPDSRRALDAATSRTKDKMTKAERSIVLRILGRETLGVSYNPLSDERKAYKKYKEELDKLKQPQKEREKGRETVGELNATLLSTSIGVDTTQQEYDTYLEVMGRARQKPKDEIEHAAFTKTMGLLAELRSILHKGSAGLTAAEVGSLSQNQESGAITYTEELSFILMRGRHDTSGPPPGAPDRAIFEKVDAFIKPARDAETAKIKKRDSIA